LSRDRKVVAGERRCNIAGYWLMSSSLQVRVCEVRA